MSFLYHTGCDSCGSSDARAIYVDGSEHCFSCKEHKAPTLRSKLFQNQKQDKIATRNTLEDTIPVKAKGWLDKYDLTLKEQSLFKWNVEKEMLVYQTNNFWTGRTFSDDPDVPRYKSSGMKPYEVLGTGNTLILVEDIISGLKVSRNSSCCVLFGASIPKDILLKYSCSYKEIVVWLDCDKAKDSIKLSKEIRDWGMHSSSIITPRDPKEYNDVQLINHLRNLPC
jgi:hypothetical protein